MVRFSRYKITLVILFVTAALLSVSLFSVSRAQWIKDGVGSTTVTGSIGDWQQTTEVRPSTDYGVVFNGVAQNMEKDGDSGYIIYLPDVQLGTTLRIWYEGAFIDWAVKDPKIPLDQPFTDKTYYRFTGTGNFTIYVQNGVLAVWEY